MERGPTRRDRIERAVLLPPPGDETGLPEVGEMPRGGRLRDFQHVHEVFSEFVATFGLLSVIWGTVRSRPAAVPFAVGAYITAAYWFTASTSFANPAVAVARSLTDTFSGIRPADVPGFVIAQLAGAFAATLLFRWLVPTLPHAADRVVVPHGNPSTSRKEPDHAHRDL